MPDKRLPIRDEDIEAEARAMVRDMIQRARWYPGLPEEEKNRRIEEDVELNWPLMHAGARKCLGQRKKP
jgi:hypothetical protein